jgi:hypothetical protein
MKRYTLFLLAMAFALLLPVMPVQADYTDYIYTETVTTPFGEFDIILSFNSTTDKITLQINGLEVDHDSLPFNFTLPDITMEGDYTVDPASENLTFDVCWDGREEVPDVSGFYVTGLCVATVDDGLAYNPDSNTFEGDIRLTIELKYETIIGSWTEEIPYTYPVSLEGPALPSSNPDFVFQNLNEGQWEYSEGYPALFDAPVFDDQLGLELYVSDPNRTFGYWQTKSMLNAPAAGRQAIRIYLTPSNPAGTGRFPELRIRVFKGDNSESKMAIFAQTTPTTNVPEFIEVVWESDGVTPWRLAIDLLSFVPDYAGGYIITDITNTPLNVDPGRASMYLDPSNVTISQGETASFDLYINSDMAVGGYTTLILYNPLDIQVRTLLQGRDPYLGFPIVSRIDNQVGAITLSSAQGTVMDKPIGLIHIATIEFTGNELGTHSIELTESEVANTEAQRMMLQSQTGATINVIE